MFKISDGFKFFLNPAWVANMFFTLWKGKGGGGGGGGNTTQTSYSTNLPEYAKPFYEELLKQTGKQVYTTDASGNVTGVKEFKPYTGDRIADFTTEQKDVQKEVAGMTTPGGFGTAATGLGTGQALGYGAGVGGLSQAFGYTPTAISGGTFGAPEAAAYMSPYASNVTDIAVREARKQADLAKTAGMTGAIGRGTFGGARQALLQAEQERGAGQNIANIRAQGQQDAYLNAQKNLKQIKPVVCKQLNWVNKVNNLLRALVKILVLLDYKQVLKLLLNKVRWRQQNKLVILKDLKLNRLLQVNLKQCNKKDLIKHTNSSWINKTIKNHNLIIYHKFFAVMRLLLVQLKHSMLQHQA
jgi:hypothetical protein